MVQKANPLKRLQMIVPPYREEEDPLDMTVDFLVPMLLCLVIVLLMLVLLRLRQGAAEEAAGPIAITNIVPGSLDDQHLIQDKLDKLPYEEQSLYRLGEEHIRENPPSNDRLLEHEQAYIEEEGVAAWSFDETARVTELQFEASSGALSCRTNLPMPRRLDKASYFECKVMKHSPGSTISVGLCTDTYPTFRLPGRHHYSIALDSNGKQYINSTFDYELLETFTKGDIIGMGMRKSGTIFFTKNGKKIGRSIRGWGQYERLYPVVGCVGGECEIHVNMGAIGYVLIEGNVKKWGFAGAGNKAIPPSYREYGRDMLLDVSSSADYASAQSNHTRLGPVGVSTSYADNDTVSSMWGPPPGFEYDSGHSSLIEEVSLHTLPSAPPTYDESTDGEDTDLEEHLGELDSQDLDAEDYTANTEANQFV